MSVSRLLPLSLCLSLVSAPALAADWVGSINQVRAAACGAGKGTGKVASSEVLDRAAARLAAGDTVEASLRAAGYAASESYAMSVSGSSVDPSVLGTLDVDACRQIAGEGLTQAGVFHSAQGVWLILARPLKAAKARAENTLTEVLAVANKARAAGRTCGDRQFMAAPPLKLNPTLSESARSHSEDMAEKNYFDHVSPDGSRPLDRVRRAGYVGSPIGENIAAGADKAADVVAGWLRSPTHCANLMNPAFREIGVGVGASSGSEFGIYWTAVLGAPDADGPNRRTRQQHAKLQLAD